MDIGPGYPRDRSARESHVFGVIFLALAGVYLFAGVVMPALGDGWRLAARELFGFSQLRCLGAPCILIGLSIPLFLVLVGRVLTPGARERLREWKVGVVRSAWVRVLAAVLLVGLFFVLRSNFLNYDGGLLAAKFARDVPLRGAHVTHDEMWELYLHSRFWALTSGIFGWSVELSYQVLSSLAGGAFILMLLYFCQVVFPRRPLLAFVLCVSGGYMQLFFGDVENYTLTMTWIMGYFLASALYLRGRMSLVIPSVLLAAALTFHLLAGFLIPSLVVLFAVAWRNGDRRAIATSAGLFCAIVGLTLLFFHTHGLPIRDLWYHSHAFGHGGHIRQYVADPSPGYYFRILNLAFLLAPAWILIIPLVLYGRVGLDDFNLHLIAAAIFMGIFVLGWKATLGVYSDWNMFAPAALPFVLLVVRGLIHGGGIGGRYRLAWLFAWIFILHSYSWIVSNHLLRAAAG